MNRSRKGLTLVEVLVAIAVISILSLSFATTSISMINIAVRQEAYIRLEMACYDINYYWDMYGDDSDGDGWAKRYFKSFYLNNNQGYLNAKFEPCEASKAEYELMFYEEGDKLIIESIESRKDGRVYVKNVTCEKGVSE